MTVLTVTNLPAATHGETVRCLFAIELSRMSWVIAFNTPLSEKISHRTLTGCKWKRLLELIEEGRARVSRETGRAVEVISCYEAGYDGFWLHRQLSAHGIRNYVIDPASLQVDRRARRVKTDRIDTERLLRSLMAYLRGEPKVWSVVRVPSVAEGDARRLHRERDRLVSERVQHVNRIKGLCALQGIYDYNPLRPQAMARLEQLRTTQGGAYNEEPTISAALRSILTDMDRYIEDRGGIAWVTNPVNPAENFADKWAEEPKKHENFYRWLDQARHDFALYLRASTFDKVPEPLREHLGAKLVDRTVAAMLPASAIAVPAIATGASPAENLN